MEEREQEGEKAEKKRRNEGEGRVTFLSGSVNIIDRFLIGIQKIGI